jgi:aryl-alcohol dehydrogenase-like predicted oxidoreductase
MYLEEGKGTIRKAAAVGPVSTVEVEYSPFTTDIEHNGVLAACKEQLLPRKPAPSGLATINTPIRYVS